MKAVRKVAKIVTIIAIAYFFTPWIFQLVYNKIAWDFNLPPFDYWVFVGIVYLIHNLFHSPRIKEEEE